jgi:hypothetical protein
MEERFFTSSAMRQRNEKQGETGKRDDAAAAASSVQPTPAGTDTGLL